MSETETPKSNTDLLKTTSSGRLHKFVMPDFDEHIGNLIDEKCPECRAQLLGNKVGDKWCSYIPCDWSNNAEITDFSKSLKA